MNVVLKTGEQIEELLGQPFDLPDGCTYQAVYDGTDLLIAVDELLLAQLWQSIGMAALCDVLSELINEAQHHPGIPLTYGPRGIERRSTTRLRAVS